MINIKYGRDFSDATYEYIVTFTPSMTVGEFIEEWMGKNSSEWGYFGIYDGKSIFGEPKCEYRRGEIITESLPSDVLQSEILSVSGSGGWTRSDFKFVINNNP